MKYTAGQAAKAVGVSTPTISRALKSGKISGLKNESGAWVIDASELHRVDWSVTKKDSVTPNMQGTVPPLKEHENKVLEPLVEALQEQIRDLRQDRDNWRLMAERLALSPPVVAESASVEGFWARLWGKTASNG
jgi:DNA-binding MurR/RpiR family transcriptional regulator